MPRVDLKYKDGSLSGIEVDALASALTHAVATAFREAAEHENEPDAMIESDDVEVYPDPIGPHAIQHHDVAIYVMASDYTSRRKRKRAIEICLENIAKQFLPQGTSAFAWVTLSLDIFVEFEGVMQRTAE